MLTSLLSVIVLNCFDKHGESVGCHVTLLPPRGIRCPQEETLQDPNQIEVSLRILGFLDGYQSFDAGPLVLNDSVDQGEGVLCESLIRVYFVDNREQNTEELLAALVLVEDLGALTLLVQSFEGLNSIASSPWKGIGA